MKKITTILFIIVCVVCIVTVFCGCEAEGNVPDSLSRDAYKAEMEVQRLRADIGDSILWDSLDRSTDLIKKSIEPHYDLYICLRLTTSSGENIPFYTSTKLNYINDVWRSLVQDGIKISVASSEEVANAIEKGETIEITGTIATWYKSKGSGASHRISVVDIEGDGKWDYVTEGEFYFTDSSVNSISGTENEQGGIGMINIVPENIVPIEVNEEDIIMKLSDMAKLVLS